MLLTLVSDAVVAAAVVAAVAAAAVVVVAAAVECVQQLGASARLEALVVVDLRARPATTAVRLQARGSAIERRSAFGA